MAKENKTAGKKQRKGVDESYDPKFKLNKTKNDLLGEEDEKSERKCRKWNREEKDLYLNFLLLHQEDFHTQRIRRQRKIFHQMHKMIPTRTADQCRGHHRKV